MSDFTDTRVVKARKPFRCELCGSAVAAGESYSHQSGIFCGEWYRFRCCLPCQGFLDVMFREYDADFDGVDSDLADAAAEWLISKSHSPFSGQYPNRLKVADLVQADAYAKRRDHRMRELGWKAVTDE